MPHIDYYFATISPFTYLAGPAFEKVVKKHGATVTYKPLDIMGLFSRTGGLPPKDRHPNRQEYRLQDMRRRAIVTEQPFNMKPAFWPTNMAPSSYAIIAAQNAGRIFPRYGRAGLDLSPADFGIIAAAIRTFCHEVINPALAVLIARPPVLDC